ncbi:MAG: TlpA family protein disulfide reductase [Burkholderiales bacterium]|nr:TlpA family protein disulfide reductase [Burkholderiales bacterium]
MKKNTVILAGVGIISALLGIYVSKQQVDHISQRVLADGSAQASAQPSDAVAQLFAMSLPDSDSKVQALSQWRGKPIVLNFWASWCAPCVKEMPALSKLQTDFAPRGVQVLGVGIDSPEAIAKFKQEHQISYPLLVAGIDGSELSRQLGNKAGGLPFTVLIGADRT